MKTFRILSCVLGLLALLSCGNKPNEKGEFTLEKPNGSGEVRIKFYDNGKIEYIQEVKNDAPEGFFINFNKSGTPKSTSTIVNGKKEGTGIVFYVDGSLNSVGQYKNDVETGFFWVWDQNKNLVEKREYIDIEGKRQMNQWIKLNNLMQPVRAESNYITIDTENDTITAGTPFVMNVTLEASFNDEYMALIVGPFDENYKLPAGSKCDTIIGKNFVAQYKTTTYKNGNNTLRGVVKDLAMDEKKSAAKSRNIYFTKEFMVKK
jgi:hypothetical protein